MTEFSNEIINLKQALEAAERVNEQKRAFLNEMCYEIRTPLNAIIGLSYLTRENAAAQETKVCENLDKIEQSAHFLLSLTEDLLYLSDLETGKVALELDTVENAVFFEELKEEMQKLAQEKQLHFQFAILNEMEQYYVFDSQKLKKAIFYLAERSVKSTPCGGMLAFEAEVLSQNAEYAILQFTVSDNGLGLEEGILPVVFEPFEPIYGENRTLYNGSGLELAITKSIIDSMNGTISVQSKKGKGATFIVNVTVRMERRKKRRPKEQTDAQKNYDFTGKRALIVEDSAINMEIARNILLHKNFEVEEALNGAEAVSAFQKHEADYYDVILMDIRMPVKNGLEATKLIREMKERPDGRKIPIAAMTANAFEEDVKKSLEAGMNGHLSKPLDMQKTYELLDMLLNEEG